MKTSNFLTRIPIGLCLLAAPFVASAQDGTWTNDASGAWSQSTNWLGGAIADGAGNTATFTNGAFGDIEVNMDTARTVGGLVNVSGLYTITNNGADTVNILTLEGPSKPLIEMAPGMATTIRRTVIAGTDGFVLDGGGTLNIYKAGDFDGATVVIPEDPTNTITGSLVLSNGTIQIQGTDVTNGNDPNANDKAFPGITDITFYNGSTYNMVSDVSTSPSYGRMHANWIVPVGHSGNLFVPGRWSGVGGTGGSGMDGTLTGGGTFNLTVKYVRGNIGGDWSAFTGQINVNASASGGIGDWRFGNAAGFPNAVVNLTGTDPTLNGYYYPAPGGTVPISIGALMGDNADATLTGGNGAATIVEYRVGAKRTNPTDVDSFAGTLADGTGLHLVKEGVGTLQLWGNNTHSGGTTISNGVLQVGDGFSDFGSLGTGPIVNHSALVLSHGTTLTVPGAISGAGSVTNNGFGVVTLTGANTYSGPTVVDAIFGLTKLVFGSASAASGSITVSDFASLGALVTSAGASGSVGGITFGSFASYDFDLSGFGNPTVPVAISSGTVSTPSDVTVNVSATAASPLAIGTVTLLEYASRSGVGSFVLGTLPTDVTATLNDDTANSRVTLTITSVVDTSLSWTGATSRDWDYGTLNWVDGSSTPSIYSDSLPVVFDDSGLTNNVDVTSFFFPTRVTVTNSAMDYRFLGFGAVSSTAELIKQGSGTLTMDALNDYTGKTIIEAGTIEINDGSIGTGPTTNSGTILVTSTNALLASVEIASDVHGTGGLTISGLDTTNSVTLLSPPTGSLYTGGTIVTNATVEMGTPAANGLLTDGTGLGIGTSTFWGNSVLNMESYNANGGDNGYDFNPTINVPVGQTLTYQLAGRCREASTLIGGGSINVRAIWLRCYAVADWSQFTGQITFYGNGGGDDFLRLNDTLGFPNARVHLANPGGLGEIAVMMNQGAGELYYPIGELTGDPGSLIDGENGDGGDAPASTVWVVGGLNTDATYAGDTADPANADHSFVKEGTGTWTLSSSNLNHEGFTTVSNGVIALTGLAGLSNSVTVTVADPGVLDVSGRTDGTLYLGTAAVAQTLAGDGAIQGNVGIGANGTVVPGNSAGELTISGSITLDASSVVEMELDNSASPTSDRISAASISAAGTTVTVTNIGPLLIVGQVFTLFNQAVPGVTTVIATNDANGSYVFDDRIASAGELEVLAVTSNVNTTPTNITWTVSGGNLVLGWPADYTGWSLQVQTNELNVGLSTGWVTIPGSTATNMFTIPLNEVDPTVFYRMALP